ncbi:hypothetical protein [Peptacetobacter sp.]|uniref:hypothetical protein n=1 Tax=Peptacetobacter sp. TaxID=2991975 RepID=UPI003AB7E9BC
MKSKKVRNLDNLKFRVLRNDKYKMVCFTDLTYLEQKEVIKNKDKDEVKNITLELARTLRQIGEEFNIVKEATK